MARHFPAILPAVTLATTILWHPSLPLRAAWTDPTIGLPPIEALGLHDLGANGQLNALLEDNHGRVFIGTNKLLVYDGQSWLSFPIPNADDVASIALGTENRLLIGATNECGYFEESATGQFRYHSLIPQLAASERDLGTVWGCGQVGASLYYICHKKILRWDGQHMQIIPMPTRARLGPLTLPGELWVHHLETGLYRLTETGPQLAVPAEELPPLLILGLYRDAEGLITVSNQGLVRPGKTPAAFSETRLNQYLGQYRVSAFTELPDNQLAIGTLSGGLVLANREGNLLQTWTSQQGFPGRRVSALYTDKTGNLLGLSGTNFFHLPVHARTTVFNARKGLTGEAVNHLQFWQQQLQALTEDGNYELDSSLPPPANFRAKSALSGTYNHALSHRQGLLLARFGGVDFFDGQTMREVYRIPANWTSRLIRSRQNPDQIYAAEAHGIAVLSENQTGAWSRRPLIDVPDYPTALHEDSTGLLWIGTPTRGAFHYDPATKQLLAIKSPLTAQPFSGRIILSGSATRSLLLTEDHIFATAPDTRELRLLENTPSFTPETATPIPGTTQFLISLQRTRGTEAPSPGIGILSVPDQGPAQWRELDLPEIQQIGSIRTATFSEEAHRAILWLGGTSGILRVDFADLPTLPAPPAPSLQLANQPSDFSGQPSAPRFSFKDHHVRLSVLDHDYISGQREQIQTRLGTGEWSGLSTRHHFEFTNLSEGTYQFEARRINSANLASQPAQITFTILPPWYRSGIAYAGYALFFLIGSAAFIRVRERRIRTRNQQLEKLVAVRTEELVKANAAKDEFLASISHEIRNPMNGVIGIAETFPTAPLDQTSRHKFGLLRQCATHLASLLEDILDFSRVQSGNVELESVPFSLREILDAIVAMTAVDSEKYGIRVEVAVSPTLPDRLLGDPKRIRQILLNFVSNALKFSGRGQVSVTVWGRGQSEDHTEITFAISDEGPGISPEEQKKLFTRFERGAAAQQGRVPGTGLGLALCQALAEKMGGRIWLESELGQGSCFYFSAMFPTAPELTATIAPPSRIFATALVVDDEEYNRITLADHLTNLGITTQTSADGQQALALAEFEDFDLVFLDYDLPDLNGLDVAQRIRQLTNRTGHALIFATTAFSTEDKKSQCLAAGMDAFLGKPVTKDRLQQALRQQSAARHTVIDQSTTPAEPPADRCLNLRLLASKKKISFRDEVALFLSELQAEYHNLENAVAAHDISESCRLAHLLYGRCGFIYESELETTFRQIEVAVGEGDWARAQTELLSAQTKLANLIRQLSADDPAAPPASDH